MSRGLGAEERRPPEIPWDVTNTIVQPLLCLMNAIGAGQLSQCPSLLSCETFLRASILPCSTITRTINHFAPQSSHFQAAPDEMLFWPLGGSAL